MHPAITTAMQPTATLSFSKRLLDQLRDRMRYLHFSLQTEEAYVYWVKFFIRWHGLRHPREMGAKEVEAFLVMLSRRSDITPSSQQQALNALIFLYRDFLEIRLSWFRNVHTPPRRQRLQAKVPPPSRAVAQQSFAY
jgi:hypothetical protein